MISTGLSCRALRGLCWIPTTNASVRRSSTKLPSNQLWRTKYTLRDSEDGEKDRPKAYAITMETNSALQGRMNALFRELNRMDPEREQRRMQKGNPRDSRVPRILMYHGLEGEKIAEEVPIVLRRVSSHFEKFSIFLNRPFPYKEGIDMVFTDKAMPLEWDEWEASEAQLLRHRQFNKVALELEMQNVLKYVPSKNSKPQWEHGLWRTSGNHYTLLRDADESTRQAAWKKLRKVFRGEIGSAQGLALWEKKPGLWTLKERFNFKDNRTV